VRNNNIYYPQQVTVGVTLNIVPSIPILQVRLDDEGPVVQLVHSKKF
jgi:hypothetical protein